MGIQRFADTQRQASEQVLAFGQVVVLKLQQAGNGAAAEHGLVQRNLRAAGQSEKQLLLRGAAGEGVWVFQRQRGGHGAQHQRMAGADKHADAAIVCWNLRGLDVFVQIADELIAFVEQVVRAVAAAFGFDNLCVHAGNALCQRVDLQQAALDLFIDRVADLIEPLGCAAQAHSGFVHARQHHVARCHVGGRIRHRRERIHHVADGPAQAGRAAAEHVLQLCQAVQACVVAGFDGRSRGCLARQQLVVAAQNSLHIDTLADVAAAGG